MPECKLCGGWMKKVGEEENRSYYICQICGSDEWIEEAVTIGKLDSSPRRKGGEIDE